MNWLKERLARVTSSGDVIPELDGIRSLALLAVLNHHILASYLKASERFGKVHLPEDWKLLAGDQVVRWNLHLYFAIPVFFAMSGFILAHPFARRYLAGLPPPSARSFFLRRVIRMEPPYFVSCIILFLSIVLPITHKNPAAYFHAFFPHLVASLFYVHSLIFGEASWINGVSWTLEVDVHFYLLVPLLARVFRIKPASTRRTLLFILIVGFSLLSQIYIEPSMNSRLRLSLANFMQFFLVGFLAADLYVDRTSPKVKSLLGDVYCLSCAVLIMYVIHSRPAWAWSLPLLLLPLLTGALAGRFISSVLASPLLTIPGGMCYTIYLYHELIIRIFQPFTVRFSPPSQPLWIALCVQSLILLVPVLIISIVLFLALEKPFMILSRDISRKYQAKRAREMSNAA